MSATLCMQLFYIKRTKKPDFQAGYDFINTLSGNKDIEFPEQFEGQDVKEVQKECREYLNVIEDIFLEQRNDASFFYFKEYIIFFTAGMSWGDDPTESYRPIEILDQFGILKICGFNHSIIDHEKILKKVLNVKEVLPLISGIDEDLDAMINSTKQEK